MSTTTTNSEHALTNLLIRASAGTGKTYQLSNRYLSLLAGGVPPERILATTFTRAAAGEIFDRVVLRLAVAALDKTKCVELAKETGADSLTPPHCQALLADLTRGAHRVRIGTLDSFFAQVARAYCLELGLSPSWRIVEQREDQRLRSLAIEALLAQHDAHAAVTLLQLLAKGTATRSVSRLLRDTVNDLYSLFLETDASAWRCLQRSKELPHAQVREAIDALRRVELTDKRFAKARDGDCQAAAEGQWEKFITGGIAGKLTAGETMYWKKAISDELTDAYEPLLRHARAYLVGRVAMQTEGTHLVLEGFHQHYQKNKRQHRAMRFDDVTRSVCGANVSGGVDGIAFRLGAPIDHLLLDEFQDTSPLQWRAIQPFARRVTEPQGEQSRLARDGSTAKGAEKTPGGDRSFFCVGDAKQAIYGWRGGVAEIFEAVERYLPGLEIDTLDASYRSSQPVIDTVNRVFQNMTRHTNLGRAETAVRRWSQQFPEHTTKKSELPGYVCLSTAAAEIDLFEHAAGEIARIVADAPGRRVGVLVRKNETVARLIHLLRSQHRIEASEEGGNPLTDSAAVLVVMSLLRLADHPGDTAARFHVARSPLGPVLGLADHTDDEAARTLSRGIRRRLVEEGYGPVLYDLAEKLAEHCNRRELSRLLQLVELAYSHQPSASLRTADFLSVVEAERVADPLPVDVRVMTIHKAKGLEFDVVVLPELEGNIIGQPDAFVVERPEPTEPATCVCRYVNESLRPLLPQRIQVLFDQWADRQTSESLCLLYVAMTRAIFALHMIVPPPADNERKPRANLAGLLRAALVDETQPDSGTLLYEHGDAKWFARPEARSPSAVPGQGALPALAEKSPESVADRARSSVDGAQDVPEVRLAPMPARRRGLERVAPSSLEGGGRLRIADVLSDGDSSGRRYGTIMHAWLALIEWLNDGRLPNEAALLDAAGRLDDVVVSPNEQRSLIGAFRDMLAKPVLADLLKRDYYRSPHHDFLPPRFAKELRWETLTADVRCERRFALRRDDRLVTGSIDRLVLLRDNGRIVAADVLDFKTDAVTPERSGAFDERVDYYRPQLAEYRRAVSDMLRLEPERVAARLVFVRPGVIVPIVPVEHEQ